MRKSGSHGGRSRRQGAVAVRLPADLGIETVHDLHTQLLAQVDEDKSVTLDGAEVARIHTAALQLLAMFCRDRHRAGREIRWRQPSAPLCTAAALLGMTQLIQLPGEPA